MRTAVHQLVQDNVQLYRVHWTADAIVICCRPTCGVMHCQIAIHAQHCTRKARAEEMARGSWVRWSVHAVPHWECRTIQCGNCREYPVPAEEAHEDGDAEEISFHMYEYKVSLHKVRKECRQLELVQKREKIGKFHSYIICQCLAAATTT